MIYHAVYYFDSVDELKQSSIMFSNKLRGHVVVAHLTQGDPDGEVHVHVVLDVPKPIVFPTKYFNIGSKISTVCVRFDGCMFDLFQYLLNDLVFGHVTVTGTLSDDYRDYLRHKGAFNK